LSETQQADLAALAKGGRTNVIGFLIRLAARVPFLFIAGRIYGPEALGRMAYAVLVVEFAAQIATMGLKRGLALQLTSDARGPGHVVWDALLLVLVISTPLTIALMLFPQAMFPNSEINGLELLLPLVVFAFAATEVMLAALAYRFNVSATVTARAIVEPWTISIAAFSLSWWSIRDGLLLAYAISMFAAFLAALIPFVRTYEWPGRWRPKTGTIAALARRNLPLAAADAVEWGSRRIDLAILGLFVSPAAVGIYYVAQQLASLPQKLKTSFDPVLGPVITRNLEAGNRPAVAAAISQVGFWILAAQAGIALALGIPGAAVMGLIGKAGVFVGGNGALAFLLIAEVLAATAVVSEAALVYIARHRNLMISLVALGLQAVLSFGFILWMLERGYPELWIAAAPALALAISLGVSAIVKSNLAARLLQAPISLWRWPLLLAAAVSAGVGGIATATPEWSELIIGVPAMLAVYCWVIWRFGFKPEDRKLFAKTAFNDAAPNDGNAASR
jgi:O-antigen/teichoic acid export membrane protein